MKVLVTRVNKALLIVSGKNTGAMGKGLVVFIGLERDDKEDGLPVMADKITRLRIFEDREGKLRYSLKERKYPLMCVPNFTLCAGTGKGRRPGFERAMGRDRAGRYFSEFVKHLRKCEVEVYPGVFGAHMDIDMEMDGPVNIFL